MRKDYPNLGEIVYETKLSNGLLIRVVRKENFSKLHAFLAVDYGSMDTAFSIDGENCKSPFGVAHYLEHKMFDMPQCNVMQLFSQYGGSPNAFTSYDITAYYVECTECFSENIELLLKYVSTPYFTQESVEKERGIIAQEIRMYEDNPDSRVFDNLFSAMYASHPVRNSIAGTVESIGQITAQTLQNCYDAFYRPENMVLCVVGDIDPEAVFSLAERVLPVSVPAKTLQRDYGEPELMLPLQSRTQCKMEVSMPMFTLGFKTEPAVRGADAMAQEIIGDLAAEILVGESSQLYTHLYEKGLIDSGFSCGYEGLKGAALLTASGDSRDPAAVMEAIILEAERVSSDGIDQKLFERLKKSSVGRRMRDLDSFSSICYRMCAYHFEGIDYFAFPEIYSDVTQEQVARFLEKTVTAQRSVLSVVSPMN